MNERQTYKIKHKEAQMHVPRHHQKAIFRDLYTKVSPHALKEMVPQYEKVINHTMKPCTKYFTTTMGLPCAHVMERRMAEGAGVLLLEDIHSHWRIDKPDPNPEAEDEHVDENITELLRVNEPAVVKPAGRPPGAKNKKKRTRVQAFEDSTQREPSEFEHILQQRERERERRRHQEEDDTRARDAPITAAEVAEREEEAAADAFFGPRTTSGGGAATSRGGRPMQQPARRRGGRGGGRGGPTATRGSTRGGRRGTTPAWQQGAEGLFGSFQL